MNRLEQWLKSAAILLDNEPQPEPSPESQPQHANRPASAKVQTQREPFQFILPEHYEAGYAYPLIVWLHGAEEDECKFSSIFPRISLRNYVGVAIRGTNPAQLGSGFAWNDSAECIDVARIRVAGAVEYAARQANVAPHRVFLAGRGEGGTMALRLALADPSRYCGALSFGGGFPRGQNVLSRLKEARQLPLFLAVGGESLDYPTQQLCDDLRLCHLAWLSVSVKQYHPCGDELVVDMMSDANEWMMNLVTSAGSMIAG
jgi:phospholipase/carboxylesterase